MDDLKRYTIQYTKMASNDMQEKMAYISQQFRDTVLAIRWYEKLKEEIQEQLETMPNKFSLYSQNPWKEYGIRIFPTKGDVILYSVDKENCVVYIRAVCTKGRDINAHLSN